jgi:hypothetical protein
MEASELPELIGLERGMVVHKRMTQIENFVLVADLEDPYFQAGANCLAEVSCLEEVGRSSVGTVEEFVEKMSRCLYQPSHVAASFALVRCRMTSYGETAEAKSQMLV